MPDPRRTQSASLGRQLVDAAVEEAAEAMYFAGPWGKDPTIIDGGLRCLTDSHYMDVYRALAREAIGHYLDALNRSEARSGGAGMRSAARDGAEDRSGPPASYVYVCRGEDMVKY